LIDSRRFDIFGHVVLLLVMMESFLIGMIDQLFDHLTMLKTFNNHEKRERWGSANGFLEGRVRLR
jgi:hypothetical protein